MWDKLDTEIGHIFQKAERTIQLPRYRNEWSPTLAQVGSIIRYWRTRLALAHSGGTPSSALWCNAKALHINDDYSDDLSSVEAQYLKAQLLYQHTKDTTAATRATHLDQLLLDLSMSTSPHSCDSRKAVNAIKGAEQHQRMFQNIKCTLRPIQPSLVSLVNIPNDMLPHVEQVDTSEPRIVTSNSDLPKILQRTIHLKRAQGTEEWVTIIDQMQFEAAILMYNHQHFQQAKHTPFGSGTLASLIGSSGLTEACTSILDGTFTSQHNLSEFKELKQFIIDLATPHKLRNALPINTELTVEEYSTAISRWRKSTTTSPSGRHLGIYRATLNLGNVKSDMCELLNIVSRVGLAPQRWQHAVSALIERIRANQTSVVCELSIYTKRTTISFSRQHGQGNWYIEAKTPINLDNPNMVPDQGELQNVVVLLKRLTYNMSQQL